MYKKYDKNILPNDIFLKKNYPDSTSSPGKFNKKGPLTSSITPITIARPQRSCHFLLNSDCNKLKIMKLMNIFQKSFNVTATSSSKKAFFFSVVKIIKNSWEIFFFNRKVKLGFAIETTLKKRDKYV